MRRALLLLVLLTACNERASGSGPEGAATSEAKAAESWVVVPAGGSLGSKIEEQVGAAKAVKLKPVVYVGATWCGPCVAIKKTKGDSRMKEAFSGVFVIEVDMDQWKKEDFAALGMNPTAIPVFYAVDDAGKATGKQIDGGAWGDNIPENMAPPLKRFFAGI
ncbi:MAG: thioredoxin family protein [Myxococcales bacterium]|nr:thioredoxin family protein [Myxococcales bacterium]